MVQQAESSLAFSTKYFSCLPRLSGKLPELKLLSTVLSPLVSFPHSTLVPIGLSVPESSVRTVILGTTFPLCLSSFLWQSVQAAAKNFPPFKSTRPGVFSASPQISEAETNFKFPTSRSLRRHCRLDSRGQHPVLRLNPHVLPCDLGFQSPWIHPRGIVPKLPYSISTRHLTCRSASTATAQWFPSTNDLACCPMVGQDMTMIEATSPASISCQHMEKLHQERLHTFLLPIRPRDIYLEPAAGLIGNFVS